MPLQPPNPNRIKVGDTTPLVVTLSDVKGPVNLSGVLGVEMRMRQALAGQGHAEIDGTCAVLQTTNMDGSLNNKGKVRYSWGAGETDTAGLYVLDWRVTFADGTVRTFPNDRAVDFAIEG